MKFNLLIGILMFFIFSEVKSQSSFFFKTSEALKFDKEKAITNDDNVKLSEIAKELESRKSEKNLIESLQIELDNKVDAQDYIAAESIKTKLNKLKTKLTTCDDLRKKIESVVATEDYLTAEKYKKELVSIYNQKDSTSKSETNNKSETNTKTEILEKQSKATSLISSMSVAGRDLAQENPIVDRIEPKIIAKQIYSQEPQEKKRKAFIAYSIGGYAPFGVSFGLLGKHIGWSLSIRTNSPENIPSSSSYSDYLYDKTYNYTYINTNSRIECLFSLSFKLLGTLDNSSLFMYLGSGYGHSKYYYKYTYQEYSNYTGNNQYYTQWVSFSEFDHSPIAFEYGLVFNVKHFYTSLGLSSVMFNDHMANLGIGLSF